MSVKLRIDGRWVEVEPETTILEAARSVGVEIPTLCHGEGLEPVGSCFVCAVEIEGLSRLIPSCVARVDDGMVVRTQTDAVRSARRSALELLLSDHAGDCVAPCVAACPAGMDIPAMNLLISQGRFLEAGRVARRHIPFPAVLGRICPRPCERVCHRASLDEAVSICQLKRAAGEALLSGEPGGTQGSCVPARSPSLGKRVAVVGAGPAGMTAAYFLSLAGVDVTLLDRETTLGGRLYTGIPPFRLPREVLDRETLLLNEVGVKQRLGRTLGKDLFLKTLQTDYDAVLLALGADGVSKGIALPRRPEWTAWELLCRAGRDSLPRIEGVVAVAGGGNEAVQCARICLRQGASEAILFWDKGRESMTCFKEALIEAEAEGVRVVEHANLQDVSSACIWIQASERCVDLSLLSTWKIACSRKGVQVNRRTLQTNQEGIFAAGEVVSGPGSAIRSLASGQKAAQSILSWLRGDVLEERHAFHSHLGHMEEQEIEAWKEIAEPYGRQEIFPLSRDARVEGSMEEMTDRQKESARIEARRCLQCTCPAESDCRLRLFSEEYEARQRRFQGERRTLQWDLSHEEVPYDSGKCILCGLCVRTAQALGCKRGLSFWGRGFQTRVAVPFGKDVREGLADLAVQCARMCPTGALILRKEPNS